MAKLSVFNRPRPPRVVPIGGHKIKVRVVKYLVDDDGNELAGAYNGETKTIFLLASDDWRSTLWHEILHCCWHLSGAGEGLTMAQEERLTVAAENLLGPLLF